MYDRGLATRLHELTATLSDLEETRMFDGVTYIMAVSYTHLTLPTILLV